MKQKIYLLAFLITGVTLGLYLPKVIEQVQAYQIQKIIDEKKQELDDLQKQWREYEDKQDQLHRDADYIREFLSDLGYEDSDIQEVEKDINQEIIDCYEYTGEIYNNCIGDIIQEQRVAIDEKHNSADKKMLKKERSREDGRQAFVNYAYQIGGEDLVYLIECENANWDMYRQSEVVKNGKREDSHGFCQINRKHYKNIVDNEKFWGDWKRQLDRCKELMDNGTPFYGRDRNIKGVRCSDYVKDRFYFG